jgi:thermitase
MKTKSIQIATLALLALATANTVNAQLIKNQTQSGKISEWSFQSAEDKIVYGAGINKAYDFLKNKQQKKKPIVAIIGAGVDVEHEDLKNSLWVNPNEKPDGIDNDKNGLVDDINGWNFLGNANGDMVDATSKEAEREFFRLRTKYEGLFENGDAGFMRFDDNLKKPVMAPAPLNRAEYDYYTNVLNKSIAGKANSYHFAKICRYYVLEELFPELKKKLGRELTFKDVDSTNIYDPKKGKTLKNVAGWTLLMMKGVGFGGKKLYTDMETFYKYFEVNVPRAKEAYDKALAAIPDARKITGDDPMNIAQKNYGNHNLFTTNSISGTMVAGIVAARRDNNLGVNGVSNNAQIMTLRTTAKAGEPYYKDIALAIRYAVDHNADIITMDGTYVLYPEYEAKWVNDALAYAETKGVLVIAPVRDASINLAKATYYPNRQISNTKELGNFMTVAASDSTGKPMPEANYGKKQLDLFAPGMDIYSTYIGDTYRKANGSGLAAATTAGVAALIKSYYPQLTGTQIRTLLMSNVTSQAGTIIEKKSLVDGKPLTDQFLFEELCSSGGILNAYKAVVAADQLSNKK